MTTLMIELDDELARAIEERAKETAMTPTQLATAGLREYLKPSRTVVSDEEFEQVARRVIERDRELLERLAK